MRSERDRRCTRRAALGSWLALATLLSGCPRGLRPFPLEPPLTVDEDQHPFEPMPEEYFSPFAWDGANQMLFRPVSRFFAVDPGGESINVNAMDEVPNSSWWTNRIGARPMSLDELTRAACDGQALDPKTQWTVTDAKPNGANPGFIIEDTHGQKYLLKFDGLLQGPRATSADVIGSILYYAIGYYAPCNRVVHFDPSILVIEEGATAESATGDEIPLTRELIDLALSKGQTTSEGLVRASSSRFLEGRPLGPWSYEGTRDGDPNDVVPHDDRREIRGAQVPAAWLQHFDAREQNTLSTWVPAAGDKGYVRHYYIDFGDCFGSLWDWDGISRRLGYSSYMDIPDILADFVTFGVLHRPWEEVSFGPTGPVFGYFDVAHFEPDEWEPGYPNPAFMRMTERDAAWMTRIIARITDEHLRAAIDMAKIEDEIIRNELFRVLRGRRNRIISRWFRSLSPLTEPRLVEKGDGARLCLRDLAVESGLVAEEDRLYWSRAFMTMSLDPVAIDRVISARSLRQMVCVDLPVVPDASRESPRYLIVDVAGLSSPTDRTENPVRVHLYHLGGAEYRVVGLERPDDRAPPG